jgi:tetratricopeptide (TPR) repeat protein
MTNKPTLATVALLLSACGPHIRPLQPVMDNGEVLGTRTEEVVERARVEGEIQRDQLAEARGAAAAAALASCSGEICEAVARGEVALGMNEAQVLAATRTTPHAWDVRSNGRAMLMTPRSALDMPEDAVARVALVSLQGGRVASYTYREPQGFRTVATPQDASFAGRAASQAEALLRQGDRYTLAGRLDLALERYDQADILRPGHPETTLRIARTLDKQLRPIEAVLRYRMFIHQMELERIRAEGDVAAKIAEAIARAHERIVVLEKR